MINLYRHFWTKYGNLPPADDRVVQPIKSVIQLLLGATYGRYPIKFILPECVSYLGERRVLCVGNGSHFCTLVLMNMYNTAFHVLRLSTFVFTKYSEKKNIHDYILWLRA